MGCYRPIPARQDNPGGKVQLWPPRGENGISTDNLHIPCGNCIGCKTDRANQWAHRCEHEAKQWESNIFLTLTYDDEHLPKYGYLDATELQRFIKRLRKSLNRRHSSLQSSKGIIRYFACGEYGTQNGRPHYHILVFGLDITDKKHTRTDKRGNKQYNSDELGRLWPYGRHEFGAAQPAAANYIAQYSLKKQRTAYFQTKTHGYQGQSYESTDTETGEITTHPKPAPFLRMSLKPGIGAGWLDKYATDLRHGYLVVNGAKFKIPRTYRERLKLSHPHIAEEIEVNTERQRRSRNPENTTPERLAAGEVIHQRRKHLTETRKL